MKLHDQLCQHQTIIGGLDLEPRNDGVNWFTGYDTLSLMPLDFINHAPISLDERKESLRHRLEALS